MVRRARWLWLMALFFPAADAAAQPTAGPIPRFVVDARGSLARFMEDTAVASALQVDSTSLPTLPVSACAVLSRCFAKIRRDPPCVGISLTSKTVKP